LEEDVERSYAGVMVQLDLDLALNLLAGEIERLVKDKVDTMAVKFLFDWDWRGRLQT
jgi:hypothetical protein